MVKNLLLTASAVCLSMFVQAQTINIDFEALTLTGTNTDYASTKDTFDYTFTGTSNTGGHIATFYGTKPSWGGYSGFNYSNVVNDTTAGYTNASAAYAPSGAGSSAKYVISYGEGYGISFNHSVKLKAFDYTNATYAGLSMKNGDSYSKKFGGVTGNDPDFFSVTVFGYLNGTVKPDSVTFYLADFRDANNANDYIVKAWRTVNLTTLGSVDSLSFKYASSDVGSFGVNTPVYFCMDNLTFVTPVSLNDVTPLATKVYPNPAVNNLTIAYKEPVNYQIFDVNGKLILAAQNTNNADISSLAQGNYFIKIATLKGDKTAVTQFVKQ
ncbi:PEP-CTERM sorting domain-containing protein [Taibaiella sp. KBW10]|uniref:T9SS type A sorting domain-containing protein n=1 Tax=Taibaiella sp. KBW10 TaxID=2153357 RepID=UPI000F5B1589|nr:DUF4465 domain-containing protein [Taibaiella sp. KBW10]RQO30999.1 PEP-CTERM sorting domain-containing protein [Taibaiella sp. KBW10]